MTSNRWSTAGTVLSGANSGTIPIRESVKEVRVSVRPGTSATVHSTNVPVADIAVGSWEEWGRGTITADASDVVFGATALKITATSGDCNYNLTGF
jgi:hypothetical protein